MSHVGRVEIQPQQRTDALQAGHAVVLPLLVHQLVDGHAQVQQACGLRHPRRILQIQQVAGLEEAGQMAHEVLQELDVEDLAFGGP